MQQPRVFEPALLQYPNAFRAGEPRFEDQQTHRRWYAARRSALDTVLAAVSDSPYADSLVLRGSILLRAWYGRAAREPGDLDFVVVPESRRIEEYGTTLMLEGIAAAAQQASSRSDITISAKAAVTEDIWTYDRVPGRRLLLPWKAEGLPGGWVQLDFVFNEHLPIAPEATVIPAAGRPSTLLLAVTPELSLIWKIMWLVTDIHPQGKDLYDAVLLAEHTTFSYEMLQAAAAQADPYYATYPVTLRSIAALKTPWGHFQAEYPDQPADDSGYVERLVAALAATFDAVEG
ncbi:nucleotidyl transferase AbiEii/AbiGii toxin family protein [Actinospica robiniae]|uniref:nucleotidyl transferase AbiEii/AbiGii toxin family protein n=1 Tax=Actinospica robiniae TaxID=304901 RepID=UPI000424457D|nr:nucleotidyl transferase AbiEii/AbiGii toxin family protein [Actinospica robiniae]